MRVTTTAATRVTLRPGAGPSRDKKFFAPLLIVLVAALFAPLPAAASTGTITGTAFQDLNRDRVRQASEPPFANHLLYLYDAEDRWVASQTTDAAGRYSFSVPAGTYTVAYEPATWRAIWSDWVPTDTSSLRPEHVVTAPAVVDFAWRPIVKSTDVNAPISDYTGDNRLRVQSYNDVIDARTIHQHVTAHFLLGAEAPHTTIRFGLGTSNVNSTGVVRSNGEVVSVTSVSYSSYERWLSGGDWTMAHEYGHAWAEYHMYMYWDDSWRALLTARGIDPSDPRLGSSHAWQPTEIAAEDYRQLFTSDNARGTGQMNAEVPYPWDVPGYEDWLRTTFTTGGGMPTADPSPSPSPSPTTSPSPSPSPTTSPSPSPSPTTSPSPSPTTSPSPSPTASPSPTPVITASATTAKKKGLNEATVRWSGAAGSTVKLFIDGKARNVDNTGSFLHQTGTRGGATISYQVCDTSTCSPTVVATW